MNKLKNVKISYFRRRRKKKIENKRCKKKILFWVQDFFLQKDKFGISNNFCQ